MNELINTLQIKIYQITVGLLLGIILAQFSFGVIIIIVLCIFLVLFSKTRFILLVIFLLIGFYYTVNQLNTYSQEAQYFIDSNSQFEIKANVVEDPEFNQFGQQVLVAPLGFNINVLGQFDKSLNINVGDIVTIKTQFIKIKPSQFFDRVAYLRSKKIFAELKGPQIISIQTSTYGFKTILNKAKKSLSNILDNNLYEPQTTLAKGLILGDDSNFSDELKTNLKNSGLSHITSVSGYNVGLVFIAALYISKITNRKYALFIGLVVIILFWQLVGSNNLPTERATLMLCFVTIGSLVGRKVSYFYAILLSTLLVLIEYPGYLFNISFQLSLSAIIALMLLAPHLIKSLEKIHFKNIFTEIIATSLAVIVFTLPLSYLTFGQVSALSLISNILALPLVPVSTTLIILSLAANLLNLVQVSYILFFLLENILKLIILVINTIFSFSSISNPFLVLIFFGFTTGFVIFFTLKFRPEQ